MTITFKKYYFILKGMELEGDMFREQQSYKEVITSSHENGSFFIDNLEKEKCRSSSVGRAAD